MNRYQGNTGRVTRIPDPPGPRNPAPSPGPPPAMTGNHRAPEKKAAPPMGTGGGLNMLLSGLLPEGFEMEDALLLLILFLLYRETGDREFLIVMGAMFLM